MAYFDRKILQIYWSKEEIWAVLRVAVLFSSDEDLKNVLD